MPIHRLIALALLPFALLIACGGDGDDGPAAAAGTAEDSAMTGDAAPAEGEVEIAGFKFAPGDLTVAAGIEVTWTNTDDAVHSVQDDSDLGFETSEHLDKGDTFSVTYDEPGEYAYFCGIHQYMKGTVVVE